MAFEQWLAYFIACWLISLSPGAGAVSSMSAGRQCGFKLGFWNIVGLQIALVCQVAIVAVGLGAILSASELAFTLIKWFGVGYLLYLGWLQWRSKATQIQESSNTNKTTRFKLVLRGFLVNMGNPKAIVFFLAILPQFIDPSRPLLIQYVWIAVTMVVVDTVVMMGYTGLAARVLNALRSPKQQKLLNRVFGGLFMGAAGLLATVHRSI